MLAAQINIAPEKEKLLHAMAEVVAAEDDNHVDGCASEEKKASLCWTRTFANSTVPHKVNAGIIMLHHTPLSIAIPCLFDRFI